MDRNMLSIPLPIVGPRTCPCPSSKGTRWQELSPTAGSLSTLGTKVSQPVVSGYDNGTFSVEGTNYKMDIHPVLIVPTRPLNGGYKWHRLSRTKEGSFVARCNDLMDGPAEHHSSIEWPSLAYQIAYTLQGFRLASLILHSHHVRVMF